MNPRRSGLRALAPAVALALLAPACGQVGKGPELVVSRRLEGEPRTLNPLLATSDSENVVLALVCRNLLDYDSGLSLVPGLAESVEADPSRLVYTVRLKEGLRWEDGAPITADDVAFTLRAIVDPKTPALYRRSLFESLDSVEVVDARTARARFRQPSAGQRDAFNLPVLPSRRYRSTDLSTDPHARAPLASGPFRLASWDPGRGLRLVVNTQYDGPRPPAEQVVFRVVPETSAAFQGLSSGALDEMRLNDVLRREAEKRPGRVRTLVYDELAYTFIAWNNRLPLFADARVRRALTMLIDRESIARTLYGGLARAANGPIPPGLSVHDATLAPWPHDPAAAAALLAEAGFRKGGDGVLAKGPLRFAFSLSLGAGSDRQRQIVETVQQAFRAAGIEMAIRPAEWAAFVEEVDRGGYEAAMLALNLDPNPDLTPNWHSASLPPAGMNHVGYRSPRADALMDELKRTFEKARAKSLYGELQRVLHEDEPVSFLHFVSVSWGVSARMSGVGTSPIGLYLFWPGGASWKPGRGIAPAS